MKTKTVWILTALVILAASPASAWFGGIEGGKNPESGREPVRKAAPEVAGKPAKQQGFLAGARAAGRDIKLFFRDFGRGARKSSQETAQEAREVPGELKKESQQFAESFKGSDKKIARETQKGAKAIGKAFKQLGKDFKEATQKTRDPSR